MELEQMMMVDKLPDLYAAYTDNFHGASNNSNDTAAANANLPHNFMNSSTPFMDLPSSTISFTTSTEYNNNNNNNFLSNFPSDISINNNDHYSTQSEKKNNSMAAMREMIFRIAAMQPIHIDPESVKPPKRRNVKISKDPQSVAARHRRERISERIRILQRLVPGGTKMDTASMLDEAIHYVKFLKTQVQSLERAQANRPSGIGFPVAMSSGNYVPLPVPAMGKPYQNVHHYEGA